MKVLYVSSRLPRVRLADGVTCVPSSGQVQILAISLSAQLSTFVAVVHRRKSQVTLPLSFVLDLSPLLFPVSPSMLPCVLSTWHGEAQMDRPTSLCLTSGVGHGFRVLLAVVIMNNGEV